MENTNSLGQLLTLRAVAHELGKSSRTVRRLVGQGVIPAYRLPGARGLYFRAEEILAALEPVQPDGVTEETDDE